jgi:uncharacterized protein YfaP (DUF2135 family)
VPRPPWVPPPTAKLAVTLAWSDPVDLDLYVTDPRRETVYFGRPHGASGGTLIADARCGDAFEGERREVVFWTEPPSGRYRVGVDFIEPCEEGVREAAFRVLVEVGDRREEHAGRIRFQQREPRVLEFTVP